MSSSSIENRGVAPKFLIFDTKKDYDLSPLHELDIPPSAWLKAFSNAGVGSVYHAFASMIPKKYWHLGATLAGTATGNWFTSGSVSGTPEKAYPDAHCALKTSTSS